MDDIEIRIHEDINDYKEKYKGFTVRQWISIVATIILSTPAYLYSMSIIGDELAQWLVVMIAAPILVVGFIPIQNLDAEKMLPYIWRYYMLFAKPLPYKTEAQIKAEIEQKAREKQERWEKRKIYCLIKGFKKIKELINHVLKKRNKQVQ